MVSSRPRDREKSGKKLDLKRMPVHVAIIMDGNGRWAKKRGLPRFAGHHAGVRTADKIVEIATEFGIKVLTLYTFSTENWKRPEEEVSILMGLLQKNLVSKREKLIRNGVRLRISGDLSRFPETVRREMEITIQETASCRNMILNLALGYSGREEILEACRKLAGAVKKNLLSVDEINESAFAAHLYTRGLPDPDLIIRTSGECRLSNFLLWQCSYAELYFTEVLWPNFSRKHFLEALTAFQKRERRFGRVSAGNNSQ